MFTYKEHRVKYAKNKLKDLEGSLAVLNAVLESHALDHAPRWPILFEINFKLSEVGHAFYTYMYDHGWKIRVNTYDDGDSVTRIEISPCRLTEHDWR